MNVPILPAFSAAAYFAAFCSVWCQLSGTPAPMVLGQGQNYENARLMLLLAIVIAVLLFKVAFYCKVLEMFSQLV